MTKKPVHVDHPLAGWSEDVFKSAWLLPIAAAIRACTDGRFTKTQLATTFGVRANSFDRALANLEAGHLIKPGEWEDGYQQIHVIDPAHPFWVFIDGLMAPHRRE